MKKYGSKCLQKLFELSYFCQFRPVSFSFEKICGGPWKTNSTFKCILQTWTHLDEDYQELTKQLETVETSIPSVGLVEESEERLAERIALYQVITAGFWIVVTDTII